MRAVLRPFDGPFAALRRLWVDEHASSAVEFAMCAPILIMLSLATIEIGRAMLVYHDLSLAAFEAGRLAMVRGTGSGDPVTEAELKTLASVRLHGADPALLELEADWDPDNSPGSFVTISIAYPFQSLVGFIPSFTMTTDVTTIIAN